MLVWCSEADSLVKNIPEMEKLLQKAKSDFETAVDSDSKLSEQVWCQENSQYIESTDKLYQDSGI